MQRIKARLDASSRISKLLSFTSNYMAANRGLPALIGAGLILLSCVLSQLFMLIIVWVTKVQLIWLLLCLPALLLHLGIFTGFVGFMMVIPLGQSYGNEK